MMPMQMQQPQMNRGMQMPQGSGVPPQYAQMFNAMRGGQQPQGMPQMRPMMGPPPTGMPGPMGQGHPGMMGQGQQQNPYAAMFQQMGQQRPQMPAMGQGMPRPQMGGQMPMGQPQRPQMPSQAQGMPQRPMGGGLSGVMR